MNKLTLAPLLLALAASLAACDNDPAKDKSKATVSEPAQTASVNAASAPAPGAAPGVASAAAATSGKFAFSHAGKH